MTGLGVSGPVDSLLPHRRLPALRRILLWRLHRYFSLDWFSAVAARINNLGPDLEGVGVRYAEMHNPSKSILCSVMVLSRLGKL